MNPVQVPDGFSIEVLSRSHRRQGFRSGQEAVDRHLRERALQSQEKRLSSTRVLVRSNLAAIAGYFTLAMGQVGFGDLPVEVVKRLPRRELPVAVLTWLGVDLQFQKQGLGERLLSLALRECFDASATFPFVAVVLDCVDEPTKAFYKRWDFQDIPAHPLRLFLSAAALATMMGGG